MPALKNSQREKFCLFIARGERVNAAYVLAGYKANNGNASILSHKPDIRRRVNELMNRAAKLVEIDQARVLAELGKIGFSDIRKMFTESGSLKAIGELDDDAAACLSSIEVVTKRVPGGQESEVEHTAKIRLWDKRAALVDIGKHLGMFTEKVEHSGPDGGPIEIADQDLARLIVFQLTKAAKQAS